MKIKKKNSAKISLVLCITALVMASAVTVCLPWIWKFIIELFKPSLVDKFFLTLPFLYVVCLFAIACAVMLILLLVRVLKGNVFTYKSVALIRAISWCCILVCIPLAVCGIWFYVMFVLAFCAAFLGLVLRVVKNVIEEATAIKEENDLTV